jgi:hypothetical protein
MPEDFRQFDSQQRCRFWESHIEQWQKSGLSQAAYCRSHQLKAHRFYYWRRRVPASQDRVTFLPVALSPSPAKHHPTIRIHTPNGFTIEIEDHNGSFKIEPLIAAVAGL